MPRFNSDWAGRFAEGIKETKKRAPRALHTDLTCVQNQHLMLLEPPCKCSGETGQRYLSTSSLKYGTGFGR